MTVFWVLHRVVRQKWTDVSEVLTASIIRVALMTEAVSMSETSVNFYEIIRRSTQKAAIFKHAAVTNRNLRKHCYVSPSVACQGRTHWLLRDILTED
jgi:hypothetical protein